MPLRFIIIGAVAMAVISSGCYRSTVIVADVGWDGRDGNDSQVEDIWLEPDLVEEDGESEGLAELPPCEPSTFANVPFEGCGDGVLDASEECDDGNLFDGDGCTWDCRIGNGAGGVAGPSPLPLPRYCKVEDFKVVVPRVEGTTVEYAVTPPLFMWTGSDYRLAYTSQATTDERFHVLAFAADDAAPGLVFEMPLEFTGDINERKIASSATGIELFDLVRNWSPEEPDIRSCNLSYMAVDFEGNSVIDRVPLRSCEDLNFPTSICRVISMEERTLVTLSVHESPGIEERGMILEKKPPPLKVCELSIRNLMAVYSSTWWDISHDFHFAVNGSGRLVTSSEANYPDDVDHPYFYLGIPVVGDLLSDRSMRPLCAMRTNDSSRFFSDFRSSGEIFFAAAECFFQDLVDPLQNRDIPYLFRVDAGGNLLGPPTRMLPESFIELLDASGCRNQLQAAPGDETMGLFATLSDWEPDGVRRCVHIFQTLDLEGRLVGEPCVGLEGLPIDESVDMLQIIDVLWDGEGYAVAAAANYDTIYFWRYLPE